MNAPAVPATSTTWPSKSPTRRTERSLRDDGSVASYEATKKARPPGDTVSPTPAAVNCALRTTFAGAASCQVTGTPSTGTSASATRFRYSSEPTTRAHAASAAGASASGLTPRRRRVASNAESAIKIGTSARTVRALVWRPTAVAVNVNWTTVANNERAARLARIQASTVDAFDGGTAPSRRWRRINQIDAAPTIR